MNIRDGGELIWIMCNDPTERLKIKDYLVEKEVTLVVETEGKRFFGRFGSQPEKERWKEAHKDNVGIFGQKIDAKK